MRSLLSIMSLVSFLSFSYPSFIQSHMALYTEPERVFEVEVSGEVRGGKVEQDFMAFFLTPDKTQSTPPRVADMRKDNEAEYNYINVFGVKVPSSKKI